MHVSTTIFDLQSMNTNKRITHHRLNDVQTHLKLGMKKCTHALIGYILKRTSSEIFNMLLLQSTLIENRSISYKCICNSIDTIYLNYAPSSGVLLLFTGFICGPVCALYHALSIRKFAFYFEII